MKLTEAIEKRHSVRSFNNKKVPWEKVIEALDAAAKSPLAGNENNLKFLIVIDEKKIYQIARYADQDWIQDAGIVVVVCSNIGHLATLYGENAAKYNEQHAGAAIENFLLTITDLGLSSCWIGSFLEHDVKDLLEIPDNISVEAILPVGYEKTKSKQPKKTELENLLYWDKWKVSKKPVFTKNPTTW